jgi:acyl dehydratase
VAAVGDRARRETEVTAEMVRTYAELTGDYNRLHFDEEFVARTRFGRLIAQGGITTGLLHALVAMDLPGPGSVFVSQSWKFPKPVYIGDRLTAEGTITSANESRFLPDAVRRAESGRRGGPYRRSHGVPGYAWAVAPAACATDLQPEARGPALVHARGYKTVANSLRRFP